MDDLQTHHVLQGGAAIAPADAVLRTIVGPGFAVAILCGKGRGGGLIHLPFGILTPKPNLPLLEQKWQRFVLGFPQGRLNGARVHLVGGADMLQLTSTTAHAQWLTLCEATLEKLVREAGGRLHHVELGGHLGRHTQVNLATEEVLVRVINRRRTGGQPTMPAPEVPMVPPSADLILGGEASVNMGELRVARAPGRLYLVLGSCVGVAIYDALTQTGAVAHVVMPRAPAGSGPSPRFADTVVPALIQTLAKAGARTTKLQAKITGGSNILFAKERQLFKVAKENVHIVREALAAHHIQIIEEDVGGQLGRKAYFQMHNFEMHIKLLNDYGRE